MGRVPAHQPIAYSGHGELTYVTEPGDRENFRFPSKAVETLRSCAVGSAHVAALCGNTVYEPLFSADEIPSIQVAALSCGDDFTVVADRGGVLYTFGAVDQPTRTVMHRTKMTRIVLPERVVALSAGRASVLALTAGDRVYGWGGNTYGELALGHQESQRTPVVVKSLSGRGLRRLVSGHCFAMCETWDGQLLRWGWCGMPKPLPAPFPAKEAGVVFPLRSIAVGGGALARVADAMGTVWCPKGDILTRAALPKCELVVRVAAAQQPRVAVALTERGEIWDVTKADTCRNVHHGCPELPLGLVPWGGSAANRIVLAGCTGTKRGWARAMVVFLYCTEWHAARGRQLMPSDWRMVHSSLAPYFHDCFYFEETPGMCVAPVTTRPPRRPSASSARSARSSTGTPVAA